MVPASVSGRRGRYPVSVRTPPGGAKLFRERLPLIQAEAGYWETRVGTVHDFRVTLIDNDTRMNLSTWLVVVAAVSVVVLLLL